MNRGGLIGHMVLLASYDVVQSVVSECSCRCGCIVQLSRENFYLYDVPTEGRVSCMACWFPSSVESTGAHWSRLDSQRRLTVHNEIWKSSTIEKPDGF